MIEPDHGVVTLDAATGVHTVTPATPTARIFHNGLLISGPTPLAHFDRLQFGASMCFLFVDPQTRGDRRDPVAEVIFICSIQCCDSTSINIAMQCTFFAGSGLALGTGGAEREGAQVVGAAAPAGPRGGRARRAQSARN